MRRQRPGVLTAALVMLLAVVPNAPAKEGPAMSNSFSLTSTAFPNGAEIPRRYTCDDQDLSPALQWHGAPANTQSYALIVDDPDAPHGTWTHWVIWNIPAKSITLPEGTAHEETLQNGALQGVNDFKKIGYGGPCPPPGKPHRYMFKLYALDARLDLKAGATKSALERAMQGHILAQTEYIGTFKR